MSRSVPLGHLRDDVHRAFDESPAFRDSVLATSRQYLATKELTGDMPIEDRVRLSARYFLAELPLWLDTAGIVGAPSSLFCYQATNTIVNELWDRRHILAPRDDQGYLITTELDSDEA
ncbi:tRNA-dependent cyclodipeptide synthase [Amycolatopsis sp. NPDC004368]